MEQIYFGQRIADLRRQAGMTQETLAQKLGITNQAVSKWESDQCCPDIMQLPVLADIFEISLDALFGRQRPEPAAPQELQTVISELPWEDNDDLHAVCYIGHRLAAHQDIPMVSGHIFTRSLEQVRLEFSGNVNDLYSDFAVVCKGDVAGSVKAGDSVTCGSVGGDVHAGDGVTCGDVTGNVVAGDSVNCSGLIGMNAQAGDSIRCGGMIGGHATAGDNVECGGDIGGNVECDGDVTCEGTIGGSVTCEGDIRCGDIGGDVSAGGDIKCTGIH